MEIKQAPTLVISDENGVQKIAGVSDIKKYLASLN